MLLFTENCNRLSFSKTRYSTIEEDYYRNPELDKMQSAVLSVVYPIKTSLKIFHLRLKHHQEKSLNEKRQRSRIDALRWYPLDITGKLHL